MSMGECVRMCERACVYVYVRLCLCTCVPRVISEKNLNVFESITSLPPLPSPPPLQRYKRHMTKYFQTHYSNFRNNIMHTVVNVLKWSLAPVNTETNSNRFHPALKWKARSGYIFARLLPDSYSVIEGVRLMCCCYRHIRVEG